MESMESDILIIKLFMTESTMAPGNSRYPSFQKAGSYKRNKKQLKIDMTPMVDLGFLLISFFVITTELSKPFVMGLIMPKDGKPTPVGESNALTVLLDKANHIYYYSGEWKKSLETNAVSRINYAGENSLRNIILEKQRILEATPSLPEGRDGLMLMIKASGTATYKNMVDVLDEANINLVRRFAVVKMTEEEKNWLDKRDR